MRTDERISRIAVLSRRLRWAIRSIAALLVLATAVILIGVGSGSFATVRLNFHGVELPIEQIPLEGRLLLLACFAPLFGLVLVLLWQCDRLLRLYERGVIFSAENARIIRRCGQITLALAVVDTIVAPLAALVMVSNGAADVDVSIDVNIGLLLAGVGILVVGHVMSLGAEMAEESALTI